MKPTEVIKKYQVIIVLVVIVAVMSGIKVSYKYDPAKDTRIIPTPPLAPTLIPSIVEPEVDPREATEGGQRTYESDYPLWAILPFQGKGFVADRYLAPRKLAVKVRGLDQNIVREEIEKWLEANEIDPNSHEIEFVN